MRFGTRDVDLSTPSVMGILNVTPDSFSDGGRYAARDAALAHAERMVRDGAAFIDVGGESTRPGAQPVTLQEELDRVMPVIEKLAATVSAVISIDTSKPQVMRAAVAAGAGLINDVYALQAPHALATAAELAVPVCLMHMRGEPRTMQHNPHYDDVVREVRDFLSARAAAAIGAGIAPAHIIVDPGFGFGKTVAHNAALLRGLPALAELGFPVLVGLSRKSIIGALTGASVQDRLPGSLALAALAVWEGAAIVRTHDVAATVQAVRVARAMRDA